MRILIADDEPLALDRLRAFLADIDDVEIVGSAANGIEAAAAIEALAPDLALLDIQMPGRTGLAAATGLAPGHGTQIIFITAHEHFAADAFDLEATDYLLKPVRFERLKVAMERARRRMTMRTLEQAPPAAEPPATPHDDRFTREFWVPVRDGRCRVAVQDIEWVEAAKDYAILHTSLRGYMLRTTMAALAEQLDPAQLLRVHRSAFVRPSLIRHLRRTGRAMQLDLADGTVVPVGLNHLPLLEQHLGLRPEPEAASSQEGTP
jgi:two-component system, LytTR family, response regulator